MADGQQTDPNSPQGLPGLPNLPRQDTTGLTSMQPQIPQRKQSTEQFRAGGIMALVQMATKKIGERKQRETQQIFDRFTNASTGVIQGQSEIAEINKANQQAMQEYQQAQTPEAKQAAIQKIQQSFQQRKSIQDKVNINRTILNDMFSGPHGEKHSKLLSKGFGIDDKNAGTPERQAAIAAMKKSMGVGDKAAGILSQLPQTQQLSPDAQRQAMLQHAGVVGKPATGGQILSELGRERGQDIQATTQRLRTMAQQGISQDKMQMVGLLHGMTVSRGPAGEPEFHVMSPEERSKVPYLKAQDELTAARTEAQRAMADAKMNPNNPEMRVKMMDAQSRAVDAQARMLAAQAAQMRAMTAQAKEPPEVAAARKDADRLETEYAKAQQYVKTPSPTNDTALIFSYVRAQVAGAGRMTNVEIEQALKSGSFGTRFSNAYNRATKGELDPDFRQQIADSIKIAADKARLTAQKYDVQKGKESAPSFDELQKSLEDLAH